MRVRGSLHLLPRLSRKTTPLIAFTSGVNVHAAVTRRWWGQAPCRLCAYQSRRGAARVLVLHQMVPLPVSGYAECACVRMLQGRLVGMATAVLLIIVTLIGATTHTPSPGTGPPGKCPRGEDLGGAGSESLGGFGGESPGEGGIEDLGMPSREEALHATVQALERAARFLEASRELLNFDGVIGFRMMHAQLADGLQLEAALCGERGGALRVTPMVERVRELALRVHELSSDALQHACLSLPHYCWRMAPLAISTLWSNTEPGSRCSQMPLPNSRRHAARMKAEETVENPLESSMESLFPLPSSACIRDENSSDSCLSSLLGTGPGVAVCSVPTPCARWARAGGCTGYALSHQLLYLFVATQIGCPWSRGPDVWAQQGALCARMMRHNGALAALGLPQPQEDLFVENMLLCSMAGRRMGLQAAWLRRVVHMQHPHSGCFKTPAARGGSHREPVGLERLHKRREKRIDGGCSSHKTAVAVGLLGCFVRELLPLVSCAAEPIPPRSGRRGWTDSLLALPSDSAPSRRQVVE